MWGVSVSPQGSREELSHCVPNLAACLRSVALSVRFSNSHTSFIRCESKFVPLSDNRALGTPNIGTTSFCNPDRLLIWCWIHKWLFG